MSNTSKGRAVKGSKYMMQMAASSLQKVVLDNNFREELVWLSPIVSTDYEEYQLFERTVCEFIGIDYNRERFNFWPPRQPQWDGIAIGKKTGTLYLFEAKSHLSETTTDCSASSDTSKEKIYGTMFEVASSVYEMKDEKTFNENWMKKNYQLANRLTFLHKMKQIISDASFCGDVKLVLINFVHDMTWNEKERVDNPQDWRKHYNDIFKAMGISREKVEEQGLIEIEYSSPFVYHASE